MSKNNPSERNLSSSKVRLYKLISLSLPILFLLLLEGCLRLFSYGDNLSLFIRNPKEGYEQYLIVNPNVGKKYFQKFETTSPPNDIFLKKKPEGTFRIFVMGSSTVVGFPYENNLMFSRILHKRLEDTYPNRHIEMVNTAITAINSHTLRDYAGQILKYDPDAILVYAGHNEFYGAFGVGSNESISKSRALTRLHLWFMDFRFFQLLSNITNSTIRKIGSSKSEQVHGTLMKRIVASENIPLGSDDYKLAMKRYKQNMGDLIGLFSEKHIPVFLSDVISNVKDIKPLSYLSTGLENEAMKLYEKAENAWHHGDYELAKPLYFEAKDADGVRFRASEEVNRIIQELAREYGTREVHMLEHFQSRSPHGIIGNSIMTEHVHPNIEGSFTMADAFYSEIMASGILGEANEHLIQPVEYYKMNWGYSALDSLLAHHRIANLKTHWPFVPANVKKADYRLSYRPRTKIDSIAFTALRDPSQFIAVLRLELAREYKALGDHEAAYREYEALLRTNPYIAVNYRDAASSLIQLGDLPLALKYFKRSQEYDHSFYASYRSGEIYLIKGDYTSARRSFEEAFATASDNSDKIRTLGKLYMACVYGNQERDARAIAGQLEKYGAAQALKIAPKRYTYLDYIPFQTRDQVNNALKMKSEGKRDEALSILENSLRIYDSHVAHRYLGEIHAQQGESRKALYHLNRVYDEFSFDPQFLTELVLVHVSLEDMQPARELFNELKRLDPEHKSIDRLSLMLSQ